MGPMSIAIRRAFLFRPNSFSSHYQLLRNVTRSTNPLTSDNTPTAGSKEVDPFGIEDLVEKNASVLVQGFYGHVYLTKEEKKKESSQKVEKISQNPEKEVHEVPVRSSKLQMYDGWIKHRDNLRAEERVGGTAENYRVASFGNVRLDSDNIVENHGQYDDKSPSIVPKTPWNKPKGQEQSPEKLSSKSMTAAEFLRNFKDQKIEEESTKSASRQQVNKPINPRGVKQELQAELDQISSENFSQDYLDSNVIPKIYQLPEYNKFTKQDMWSILKKSVIFNNDFIIAINKPPGIPIHSPSIDCRHFITEFRDRLADYGQCEKVYPIHRLDKETTGVLLFAKKEKVAHVLIEKFSSRQVHKKYLVITKLCPQMMEGTIRIPIGEGRIGGTEKFRSVLKPDLRKYEIKARRGDCKDAVTHFTVIKSTQEAAFLEVRPESGVKHQIRLHLGLGIGCPVLGDQKYSHRDRMAPQRLHPILLHKLKIKQSKVRNMPLHLHCNSISFTLPEEFMNSSNEPVYIHAKVPSYFTHTLRALRF